MKKTMKFLSALMIIMVLATACTSVFATGSVSIDNMKNGTVEGNAINGMEKIGGTIVAYVTNAAMVVSIVMIAVLGVKYMLGSAEEKAEYKKSLMPLLIGAILVFGAAAIAKVIVGLAQNFK